MKEKMKQYIQQYNKGGFTYKELEWELLNLFSVSVSFNNEELMNITLDILEYLAKQTDNKMYTDKTIKNANYLLMKCYEMANGVNCHGYTPNPSKSPDYLRAKRKALAMVKTSSPEIYNYIKNHK